MADKSWDDELEFSADELSELERSREERSSISEPGQPRRRVQRRGLRVPAEAVPRRPPSGAITSSMSLPPPAPDAEPPRTKTLPMMYAVPAPPLGPPPVPAGEAAAAPSSMNPEERRSLNLALEMAAEAVHGSPASSTDSAFDVDGPTLPGASLAMEDLAARQHGDGPSPDSSPFEADEERSNRVAILLSALRVSVEAAAAGARRERALSGEHAEAGTPTSDEDSQGGAAGGRSSWLSGLLPAAEAADAEAFSGEARDAGDAVPESTETVSAVPEGSSTDSWGIAAMPTMEDSTLAVGLSVPPSALRDVETVEDGDLETIEDPASAFSEVEPDDAFEEMHPQLAAQRPAAAAEVPAQSAAESVGARSMEELPADELQELVAPPPLPVTEGELFGQETAGTGLVLRVPLSEEDGAGAVEEDVMTSAPPDEELAGDAGARRSIPPVPPADREPTAAPITVPPLPPQAPAGAPAAPRAAAAAETAAAGLPPPMPEAPAERRADSPPVERAPTPAAEADRAAEAQARGRKRAKAWFEEIFDEDFLRTIPHVTPRLTGQEVDFIEETLQPAPDSEILDLGCGAGRHAIELAGRGYRVTGYDLSLPLLIRAADDAQRRNLQVNFVHSDFRELGFDAQFDATFCLGTSFGYFDDDTNRKMIVRVNRALKPGGRFLLEVVNRDYLIQDLPARVWREGAGCVVLEEVDFNYFTSRVLTKRSVVFEDGRHLEQEISIRSYSLHELGKVLHHAGFRVLEVTGHLAHRARFFGNHSRQLFLLAEKIARQ
ncbi:MAG: methyltransferase domain-containing protein [Deltaproteobacteria bacterium]|nr:methyltransferase domain-containing protein [Deltaproteobacteria bacterium]